MDRATLFLDTFFKPELIVRYLPDILSGMAVTIEIAVLVVVAGIALGLALALVRSLRSRFVNVPILVFVDVARAMPPLVLVLIVYFGLPNVGILLPSYAVLWLVLSLLLTAFAEEIFWAGILSVRKGQWEAARSTGLTSGATRPSGAPPGKPRLEIAPGDHHRHEQHEIRDRPHHQRRGVECEALRCGGLVEDFRHADHG